MHLSLIVSAPSFQGARSAKLECALLAGPSLVAILQTGRDIKSDNKNLNIAEELSLPPHPCQKSSLKAFQHEPLMFPVLKLVFIFMFYKEEKNIMERFSFVGY